MSELWSAHSFEIRVKSGRRKPYDRSGNKQETEAAYSWFDCCTNRRGHLVNRTTEFGTSRWGAWGCASSVDCRWPWLVFSY